MATWSHLPTEIRLEILSYVFPGRNDRLIAASPLGSGRPQLKGNVTLHLSPNALLSLHRDNPGCLTTSFWPPLEGLLVSKMFAAETWSVFKASQIIVQVRLAVSSIKSRNKKLTRADMAVVVRGMQGRAAVTDQVRGFSVPSSRRRVVPPTIDAHFVSDLRRHVGQRAGVQLEDVDAGAATSTHAARDQV